MKIEVKNTQGKGVGSVDLDDAIFGVDVNEHLLWEAVKWQLAKRRAGTASTKRLGEVRGSSKKTWKQKGTGQARQGSRQAPHWVGGGSVFGPKPRDYGYELPRKIKKAALRSALSLRASEQKLVVLDSFSTDGKTKSVKAALAAMGAGE
jgi:large subunit ribosomal protein L4